MTELASKIVQKFVIFFVSSGMPRSTAKVLTFLLLCEPRQQTSASIGNALALSTGSVSNGVNSLVRAGLLRKTRLANERRYYYELDADGWRRATMQRLEAIAAAVAIADAGLTVSPDNDRLRTMRDTYRAFADEFRTIYNKLP